MKSLILSSDNRINGSSLTQPVWELTSEIPDGKLSVESINYSLNLNDWTKVRHVPSGNTWFASTDDLFGTDSAAGDSADDSGYWNLGVFESIVPGYNQIMIRTGSGKYFCIFNRKVFEDTRQESDQNLLFDAVQTWSGESQLGLSDYGAPNQPAIFTASQIDSGNSFSPVCFYAEASATTFDKTALNGQGGIDIYIGIDVTSSRLYPTNNFSIPQSDGDYNWILLDSISPGEVKWFDRRDDMGGLSTGAPTSQTGSRDDLTNRFQRAGTISSNVPECDEFLIKTILEYDPTYEYSSGNAIGGSAPTGGGSQTAWWTMKREEVNYASARRIDSNSLFNLISSYDNDLNPYFVTTTYGTLSRPYISFPAYSDKRLLYLEGHSDQNAEMLHFGMQLWARNSRKVSPFKILHNPSLNRMDYLNSKQASIAMSLPSGYAAASKTFMYVQLVIPALSDARRLSFYEVRCLNDKNVNIFRDDTVSGGLVNPDDAANKLAHTGSGRKNPSTTHIQSGSQTSFANDELFNSAGGAIFSTNDHTGLIIFQFKLKQSVTFNSIRRLEIYHVTNKVPYVATFLNEKFVPVLNHRLSLGRPDYTTRSLTLLKFPGDRPLEGFDFTDGDVVDSYIQTPGWSGVSNIGSDVTLRPMQELDRRRTQTTSPLGSYIPSTPIIGQYKYNDNTVSFRFVSNSSQEANVYEMPSSYSLQCHSCSCS